MSNKYKFQKHEDVYLTIIKYFEGDILLVKDNIIKDLENDKYRGETIKPIDKEIIKELKKVRRYKKKGGWEFIPPNWADNKNIVEEKLNKLFPKEISIEPEKISSPEPSPSAPNTKEIEVPAVNVCCGESVSS